MTSNSTTFRELSHIAIAIKLVTGEELVHYTKVSGLFDLTTIEMHVNKIMQDVLYENRTISNPLPSGFTSICTQLPVDGDDEWSGRHLRIRQSDVSTFGIHEGMFFLKEADDQPSIHDKVMKRAAQIEINNQKED